MEHHLRRTADYWRRLAATTLVLGILGAILIAIGVARGPEGEDFDLQVFLNITAISVLALMLSHGLLFMVTRVMDGLAEVIGHLARLSSSTQPTPAGSTAVDIASTTGRGRPGLLRRRSRVTCPTCGKKTSRPGRCPSCGEPLD